MDSSAETSVQSAFKQQQQGGCTKEITLSLNK